MTNLEKCNAGIEYSYADKELIALKTEAIRQCEIFNAIDGRDYMAQYRQLQQMLGAVGERVWIAKTFLITPWLVECPQRLLRRLKTTFESGQNDTKKTIIIEGGPRMIELLLFQTDKATFFAMQS